MSDPAQIIHPVVDLMRQPGGPRARQALFGETVKVGRDEDGWIAIEADKDGYCGFVPTATLGPVQQATHWVSAPSTHVYSAADMKSPELMALSFGSRVTVLSQVGNFAETSSGFIPTNHLSEIGTTLHDPVAVAARFLGTPYLWGGNSRFGIDCSGLVQAAFLACGRACPGDSGQQEKAFGAGLPDGTSLQRGDLLFWNGHVALVSDPETLLHANAGHMATAYEPLGAALTRIEAQGDGKVTSHLRP